LSLKENMSMVKEELSSEEKFFENAVKAERFVKRYKKLLIAAVVAVVLAVGANAIYQAKLQSDIDAANAALITLRQNSADAQAEETLKKLSPELYAAWQLSEALKTKNADLLSSLSSEGVIAISDVAAYQQAVMSEDVAALEAYSERPKAVYKELALLELAVLLMRDNRIDEAHQKLQGISSDSPLYRYAQPLMHYGVK